MRRQTNPGPWGPAGWFAAAVGAVRARDLRGRGAARAGQATYGLGQGPVPAGAPPCAAPCRRRSHPHRGPSGVRAPQPGVRPPAGLPPPGTRGEDRRRGAPGESPGGGSPVGGRELVARRGRRGGWSGRERPTTSGPAPRGGKALSKALGDGGGAARHVTTPRQLAAGRWDED